MNVGVAQTWRFMAGVRPAVCGVQPERRINPGKKHRDACASRGVAPAVRVPMISIEGYSTFTLTQRELLA